MKKTRKSLLKGVASFSLTVNQQYVSNIPCSRIKKLTNAVTDFVVGFSTGTMKSLFSPFRFFRGDGNILIPNQ